MTSIATQPTADLGVIALGVMGENLALNVADDDYRVALWMHTVAKVRRFIVRPATSIEALVSELAEKLLAALRHQVDGHEIKKA